MELFKAHYQWATRPDDQRFQSLDQLYKVTHAYASKAGEKMVPANQLTAEAVGEEVMLRRNAYTDGASGKRVKEGEPAMICNWAFKQLCGRVGAPAEYLGSLSPTLAAANLNHGFKRAYGDHATDKDRIFNLLFHINGEKGSKQALICRALTTEVYERIWNYELAERLLKLQDKGWEPAYPDFNADPKEAKKSTALYASDHDMFAFIRLHNRTIEQPVKSKAGDTAPLYRGAIYWNSEVGAAVLGCMFFYYNAMCGNHIIWGASEVNEVRVRHVGSPMERMKAFEVQLEQYADESANDAQRILKAAATKRIAATKQEVLDTLFGLRLQAKTNLGIARRDLEASFAAVLPEQDGDPRTVWGMAQGITRHSQSIKYTDQRTDLDRGAGKLISMVDRF